MLSAASKLPAGTFCAATAWMSAAVTPLRDAVPPPAGQAGVPAGPGALAEPHSHRKIPPLTPAWPKWMWAMNAGLDSALNVSVYESVDPVTVAWNRPTLGLSLGGLSWNPLNLALNVCDASSALAAATVSPRTPTIATERRTHLNVMCAPPNISIDPTPDVKTFTPPRMHVN